MLEAGNVDKAFNKETSFLHLPNLHVYFKSHSQISIEIFNILQCSIISLSVNFKHGTIHNIFSSVTNRVQAIGSKCNILFGDQSGILVGDKSCIQKGQFRCLGTNCVIPRNIYNLQQFEFERGKKKKKKILSLSLYFVDQRLNQILIRVT